MIITRILKRLSSPSPGQVDYEELIPRIPFTKGITHNIYQTTKSKAVSEAISTNIDKIRRLNPDWDYFLFDDSDIEEFIKQNYGEKMLGYYKRISPSYGAAKADFFRYLLIYSKGGVYLDIKSTLNKSLSAIFKDDDAYLLSYWDNLEGQDHHGFGHYPGIPDNLERGEILQWYIAASPGHPLLRQIIIQMLHNIDSYNPYINGVGWTGTVSTTGPVMYTKVISDSLNDSPEAFPVRWVNIFKDCGFQYSIFERQDGSISNLPLHTKVLPSDYRKASSPLIAHKSSVIQAINVRYLSLLNRSM